MNLWNWTPATIKPNGKWDREYKSKCHNQCALFAHYQGKWPTEASIGQSVSPPTPHGEVTRWHLYLLVSKVVSIPTWDTGVRFPYGELTHFWSDIAWWLEHPFSNPAGRWLLMWPCSHWGKVASFKHWYWGGKKELHNNCLISQLPQFWHPSTVYRFSIKQNAVS